MYLWRKRMFYSWQKSCGFWQSQLLLDLRMKLNVEKIDSIRKDVQYNSLFLFFLSIIFSYLYSFILLLHRINKRILQLYILAGFQINPACLSFHSDFWNYCFLEVRRFILSKIKISRINCLIWFDFEYT